MDAADSFSKYQRGRFPLRGAAEGRQRDLIESMRARCFYTVMAATALLIAAIAALRLSSLAVHCVR
jgi:hypothetical protein